MATKTLVFIVFLLIIQKVGLAQKDDGRLITVPVIFHVLYTDSLPDNGMGDDVRNSDKGNSTSKLPEDKIKAELKDLDQDFQLTNPDIGDVIAEYKTVIGNPHIHFVLKNIIYVPTTIRQIHARNNASQLHALSPLQHPDSCLNVYISRLRVKGKGSEGVTDVFTDQITWSDDAVNLNFSWVGLHYRLLSHEVGHWLGLWHVDDMKQANIDNITDIPVQTDLTDIPCVKCTRDGVTVVQSFAGKFTKPNTNNYMDYSGCRRMFSIQQSAYMRNMVIRLRTIMWNSSATSVTN